MSKHPGARSTPCSGVLGMLLRALRDLECSRHLFAGALRQRRALTDARRLEFTAVLAVPFDVGAGSGGGPSMIRRIAGLANRRSRAMLLRFEAVWAHMRPLVWTDCCSPSPFLAALSRETPVKLGAVTARASATPSGQRHRHPASPARGEAGCRCRCPDGRTARWRSWPRWSTRRCSASGTALLGSSLRGTG
ncbi:hypothetical protein SAFG77S_08434 [Streptomyces afghaniensis]